MPSLDLVWLQQSLKQVFLINHSTAKRKGAFPARESRCTGSGAAAPGAPARRACSAGGNCLSQFLLGRGGECQACRSGAQFQWLVSSKWTTFLHGKAWSYGSSRSPSHTVLQGAMDN